MAPAPSAVALVAHLIFFYHPRRHWYVSLFPTLAGMRACMGGGGRLMGRRRTALGDGVLTVASFSVRHRPRAFFVLFFCTFALVGVHHDRFRCTRTDAGCPAHHRVALATPHARCVLATLRLGAPPRLCVRAFATSSSARHLSTPLCNLHYTGLPSRSPSSSLAPFFPATVDTLTPTGARLSSLYHERQPTTDGR